MLRKLTHFDSLTKINTLRFARKKAHFLVPTKINTLRQFDRKNTLRTENFGIKIKMDNHDYRWFMVNINGLL